MCGGEFAVFFDDKKRAAMLRGVFRYNPRNPLPRCLHKTTHLVFIDGIPPHAADLQ
jgi:hypothetical protein